MDRENIQEMNQKLPPIPPRKKRVRTGCLWAVIAIQGVFLLFILISFSGFSSFMHQFGSRKGKSDVGVDEYPDLTEVWAYGSGDVKVVKIPLRGMIVLRDEDSIFSSSGNSAQMALRSIIRATYDEDVKAIILDVDSGGGGITASDIIYKALLDFKEEQEGRKVVALFRDVAASGAYYVSMAADHIVAHPTTITGSIGVIMQSLNLKGLGEKIGVKDVTIKSGENKDMMSPFKDMTLEQTAMLQGTVDEMHDYFVSIVVEGRKMPEADVRPLADGRIFTASKALESKLIDSIGYWDDTVEKTRELLDVDDIKIYRYSQEFTFSDLFKASQNWDPISTALRKGQQARMMYLWRP